MGDVRQWRIKTFLVLLLAATAVHCSKPKGASNPSDGFSASMDGSQNTGGGTAGVSTAAEVNEALDKALELATVTNPDENIIVQFCRRWGRVSNKSYIRNPVRLFPKFNPASVGDPAEFIKNPSDFESPFLQALKRNKITRLASGDCLKSVKLRHTDGSVSAFNVNADICFSIGNLTRIPHSTLLREVLSLVLHEATHLGGAEEDEAVGWKDEFSIYFGLRFGDLETDAVAKSTFKILEGARDLLSEAQALANIDPSDDRISEKMGKLAQLLNTLPYFRDPLALELKLNPLHPELISNYSNAVLALIQRVTIKFEIRSTTLKVKGIRIPIEFMPPDKVVSSLNEVENGLEQIEGNFSAFVGGSGAARSICVLPDTGDLNQFPLPPPGQVGPSAVPNKCAAQTY